MTDKDLISRIEALELRVLEQEGTLDELTRTLLRQEQLVRIQEENIVRIEEQLRMISTDAGEAPAGDADETPPHY